MYVAFIKTNKIMYFQVSENFFSSIQLLQEKIFVETLTIDNSKDTLSEAVKHILNKLPQIINLEAIYAKFPCEYLQPLNAIFLREAEFLNRLLELIILSLTCLEKSLVGSNIMTEELEELAVDLLNGRVPKYWESCLYPTEKTLSSFLIDFEERINYFQNWYHSGTPQKFWISGFCYVQGFLMAILQRHSRISETSITYLTFDFMVIHIKINTYIL